MVKKYLLPLVVFTHAVILCISAFSQRFDFNKTDESIHFGAGSVIWHYGQVASKTTEFHPPLSFYLNSLFLGSDPIDWSNKTRHYGNPDFPDDNTALHIDSIGYDLVAQTENAGKSVGWLFLRGRLPFIILSTILAFWIGMYLLRYGDDIALAGVVLYALSSLTLSQVPGILTDFTMTFFVTATLFAMIHYRENPSYKRAALVGFFTSLSLASKISAILLLPLVFGFIFYWGITKKNDDQKIRRVAWRLLVISLTIFTTLWATYGFQVDSFKNVEKLHHALPQNEKQDQNTSSAPRSSMEINYPRLHAQPMPMVSLFMTLRWALNRTHEIQKQTLLGPLNHRYTKNSCYATATILTYFPIALWFLILGAALAFLRSKNRNISQDMYLWTAWLLVYGVIAFRSNLQLGPRHFYALFPVAVLWGTTLLSVNFGDRSGNAWLYLLIALICVETIGYGLTGNALNLIIFPFVS